MATYGDVVDPHQIGLIDSNSITSPNVVGCMVSAAVPDKGPSNIFARLTVQLRDLNVLDDNVGGTADNTESLSLNNAARA